jgi:hypothetical protein
MHNPKRCTIPFLESQPFPLDGLATGFEDMLRDEKNIGRLKYDVPAVASVCAQDLVAEAYKELRSQSELQLEYQRVQAIAERYGY